MAFVVQLNRININVVTKSTIAGDEKCKNDR